MLIHDLFSLLMVICNTTVFYRKMAARSRRRYSRFLSIRLSVFVLPLLLCTSESYGTHFTKITSFDLLQEAKSPIESPPGDPQPLLPSSPLMPFTNLSGKCPLNFSNAENILTTTAVDCWGSLAPYLANAVCCPQLEATVTILIAQFSFSSGKLSVNGTNSKNCLSDITQVLESQGSTNRLQKLCSMYPSNLTEASCPLVDVADIETTVNVPMILESCETIDPVKECHEKVCQSAITDAAAKIAAQNYSVVETVEAPLSSVQLAMIDDCKKIVLRWLASKLDPSSANKVLRGISSCKTNKVCPLAFPDLKNVSKACGNTISNQTACCEAMGSYVIRLQRQSFVTNLQALNCAATLGANLQQANVSSNVYGICHVKLKDFSLQVGSQDSGCLFPSLPLDVTFDQSSGIGFKCDLNDNVAAPWPWPSPSFAYSPAPSSNITTDLPALPKATSDETGLQTSIFVSALLVLNLFI